MVDSDKVESPKRLKVVGEYIRKRREGMRLSQRALGAKFTPPVTTQFISNLERGVTPLPPMHVPVLAQALNIDQTEIMALLEREYAHKLSERLGKTPNSGSIEGSTQSPPHLTVSEADYQFMKTLYEAYRMSDPRTRQAFTTLCENMLNIPKSTLP